QRPDELISWRSVDGARNDGIVRFTPLTAASCRVTLEVDVEPEGAVEATGDALGFVSRRVSGDLDRFREFVENRGEATGAWRGRVEDSRVQ
ncbi:MAG TPA: SRPBCC family protein, partial [Candidatus Binatus sp.]|nr:SRPBCC family protein [Candidatus Binatus sp.]